MMSNGAPIVIRQDPFAAGIPAQKGDTISFVTRGVIANTIRLTVNGIDAGSGEIVEITLDTVVSSDRSNVTVSFQVLADMMIRSAGVNHMVGTIPTGGGQIFVEAHLIRQGSGLAVTLLRGYQYSGHVPCFPGVLEGPLDGRGRILEAISADPAAGVEIAPQTVPTSARWRLLSLQVQLVQGITQTPLPSLRFNSQTGVVAQIPITPTAIGASSTCRLTWAIGLTQISFTAIVGDEMHCAAIPDLLLVAADNFTTITDGIGANTNYGPAIYTVEEWIAPP